MARAKGALALFALLVLAPAAVLAQYDVDPDLVVATTNGKIYGEKYAGIGRAFRGVPYAAPPVGREGRWQLPRAPPSWGPDALPTRDYRPGCAQRCEDGVQLPPHTCPQLISEDCLYLSARMCFFPSSFHFSILSPGCLILMLTRRLHPADGSQCLELAGALFHPRRQLYPRRCQSPVRGPAARQPQERHCRRHQLPPGCLWLPRCASPQARFDILVNPCNTRSFFVFWAAAARHSTWALRTSAWRCTGCRITFATLAAILPR